MAAPSRHDIWVIAKTEIGRGALRTAAGDSSGNALVARYFMPPERSCEISQDRERAISQLRQLIAELRNDPVPQGADPSEVLGGVSSVRLHRTGTGQPTLRLYLVETLFVKTGAMLVELVTTECFTYSMSSPDTNLQQVSPTTGKVRRDRAVFSRDELYLFSPTLDAAHAAALAWYSHATSEAARILESTIRDAEDSALRELLSTGDNRRHHVAMLSCVNAASIGRLLEQHLDKPHASRWHAHEPAISTAFSSVRNSAAMALQTISTAASLATLSETRRENDESTKFQSEVGAFQAKVAAAGAAFLAPNLIATLWGAGLATPNTRSAAALVVAVAFLMLVALTAGGAVALSLPRPTTAPPTRWNRRGVILAGVLMIAAGVALAMLSNSSHTHAVRRATTSASLRSLSRLHPC